MFGMTTRSVLLLCISIGVIATNEAADMRTLMRTLDEVNDILKMRDLAYVNDIFGERRGREPYKTVKQREEETRAETDFQNLWYRKTEQASEKRRKPLPYSPSVLNPLDLRIVADLAETLRRPRPDLDFLRERHLRALAELDELVCRQEVLGSLVTPDARFWQLKDELPRCNLARVGGGGGGGGGGSAPVRPRPSSGPKTSSGPYMTIDRLCRAEPNKPNEYERDLMKRRGLTFEALLELEELQEALDGGGPEEGRAAKLNRAFPGGVRKWCCNNNCNIIATLCDCRECCDLLDKADWGEGPRYGTGPAGYGPPNGSY